MKYEIGCRLENEDYDKTYYFFSGKEINTFKINNNKY